MTADVPILIIGGMTAALALARAGFAAHIVQRSPEFGEIGAGIQLAPNALRILDGLGVLPESGRICGLTWHDDSLVILLRDRIFTRRDRDDYTDMDWLYQHCPEAS